MRVDAGEVIFVAFGFKGFVRSSVNVPDVKCCWRTASTAEEPGGWVPNAQMTFCMVSVLAYNKIISLAHLALHLLTGIV